MKFIRKKNKKTAKFQYSRSIKAYFGGKFLLSFFYLFMFIFNYKEASFLAAQIYPTVMNRIIATIYYSNGKFNIFLKN